MSVAAPRALYWSVFFLSCTPPSVGFARTCSPACTQFDVVAEYAPGLGTGFVEQTPPLINILCRCIRCMYKGTCHRVLRSITCDKDFPLGNHWAIGMQTAEGPSAAARRTHQPCGGTKCGNPGGSCTSPLTEALVTHGYRPLPTAEQGDCGIDVMAYWDGVVRCADSWKRLRWELAAAMEARAGDVSWQNIFAFLC